MDDEVERMFARWSLSRRLFVQLTTLAWLSHLVGASNALLVLEGTRKLCNLFFYEWTSPGMRMTLGHHPSSQYA